MKKQKFYDVVAEHDDISRGVFATREKAEQAIINGDCGYSLGNSLVLHIEEKECDGFIEGFGAISALDD